MRYDCDMCEFQSLAPEELKEHIAKAHETSAPFGCDQCAFKCASETDLRTHLDNAHRPAPAYACRSCDFTATAPEYLKLHMAREHEPEAAKFPCTECSFVGASEEGLMAHKASSHEPEAGYPCDLSNHQERGRGGGGGGGSYYEEKMAKHPYLHINGQDYDQAATLSGLMQSQFRGGLPTTAGLSVPAAVYSPYIPNSGGISYQGVPVPPSVPGFPGIPGSLGGSGPSGSLVRGGYPWTAGFNMNPSSY